MEPRGHCGTARPCGTKVTMVTLRNLMELRVHCDTAGLQNQGIHCDTAEPHGITVSMLQPLNITEQRVHGDTVERRRLLVAVRKLMEPKFHCDIVEPHGTMETTRTLQDPWNQEAIVPLQGLV
ncbi:hypothetical protein DUI87_33685 [Hirundo rustica rustica]|uniref:Uncharacterized protein n=1 Tax=Hirundo rustica rustica TaxID=333673 RepID=A0A3M0IKJ6_HIRRU|nr:hypothetical protein DUI87_33685 [Hirundo rustica rustica]